MKNKNAQNGFTLVEIAIVLMIFGVLIAGVLKGSEMIAHSKVAGTISDLKTFESSLATFQLKYNDLPGDIQQTGTRLGSRCSNAPCTTGGDRNGRINGAPHLVPSLGGEGTTAFAHMAAAGLLTGIDINGNNHGFSNALPSSKLGGGYWLSSTRDGQLSPAFATRASGGHYLVFNRRLEDLNFANIRQGMKAKYATEIDSKIDDGFPLSGDVWANGRSCIQGTGYNQNENRSSCNIFVKVM